MKVFLGNGPWYRPGYYGVRAGSRWPHYETACSPYMPFPFYLAYATALLEKDGHECLLIDGIAERTTEENYVHRAVAFDPDLIILEVSTPSMDTDIRQTQAIKEKCPNAKVVYCGLHLLEEDEDFLATHRYVDFTMRGEYDFIAQDLAKAAEVKYREGIDAYVLGHLEEARRLFEEALRLDPKGKKVRQALDQVTEELKLAPDPKP